MSEVRKNDYRFISERALDACSTYEVESISLLALKPEGTSRRVPGSLPEDGSTRSRSS